jgi:hypothetical protein
MMDRRRFLLTVGTKLPIAMVGRQTIPAMGDTFSAQIFSQAFLADAPSGSRTT